MVDTESGQALTIVLTGVEEAPFARFARHERFGRSNGLNIEGHDVGNVLPGRWHQFGHDLGHRVPGLNVGNGDEVFRLVSGSATRYGKTQQN